MNNKIINIPVFPLSGALLLPNGNLPLNIFEQRYLSMVDHSLSTNKFIGMLQFESQKNNKLYEIGCLGKITSFSKTNDNRYLINLLGVTKYKIINELKTNKNFRIFSVKIENLENFNKLNKNDFNRELLINKIKCYFSNKNIKIESDNFKSIDDKRLINTISMICPFDISEKQMLLESKNLNDLNERLIALLEFNNNNASNYNSIN